MWNDLTILSNRIVARLLWRGAGDVSQFTAAGAVRIPHDFTAVKDRRGHFQTSAAGVSPRGAAWEAVCSRDPASSGEGADVQRLPHSTMSADTSSAEPATARRASLLGVPRESASRLESGGGQLAARSGLRANTDRALPDADEGCALASCCDTGGCAAEVMAETAPRRGGARGC
jgi:hypothetical protein